MSDNEAVVVFDLLDDGFAATATTRGRLRARTSPATEGSQSRRYYRQRWMILALLVFGAFVSLNRFPKLDAVREDVAPRPDPSPSGVRAARFALLLARDFVR